jgi:hypothetical protein
MDKSYIMKRYFAIGFYLFTVIVAGFICIYDSTHFLYQYAVGLMFGTTIATAQINIRDWWNSGY